MNRLLAPTLIFVISGCSRDGPVLRNEDQIYGVVESISGCYQSKHSLRCDIKVVGMMPWRADITDFPDSYVAVGDVIGHRYEIREVGYDSYWIKNGRLAWTGMCDTWMGCWDVYLEQKESP